MLNLDWIKCSSGNWCMFENINLNHSHFSNIEGVYIIWNAQSIIRIGQGVIKDRIAAHRNDSEITKYKNILVTWARVDGDQRDGVERYLAGALKPVVGESFPDVQSIEVSLPGWR